MPSFCSALGCGLCHSFVVGDGLRVTAPVGTHPAGQVWGLGGQILAKSSKQVQPEAETCSAASRDSQKWAKAEHPAPTWSWSTSSSPVMMMRFSIRVSENPPFTVCVRRGQLSPLPQQPAPGRAGNSATGAGTAPASPQHCPAIQQSSHCPWLREKGGTQQPQGKERGWGRCKAPSCCSAPSQTCCCL